MLKIACFCADALVYILKLGLFNFVFGLDGLIRCVTNLDLVSNYSNVAVSTNVTIQILWAQE
ncbi:hypothetical protein SLEP1_g28528 [Rubroshorea leprosula]|uniref:Uncharacterized protein n=1 Tax=Rubroshorea leprosula TaxID=152421 RepID=A0AAV5K0E9_9ROSI|nr:hypothetical protein SLEP1_g28528 [Rubroshorea leprosula]